MSLSLTTIVAIGRTIFNVGASAGNQMKDVDPTLITSRQNNAFVVVQ